MAEQKEKDCILQKQLSQIWRICLYLRLAQAGQDRPPAWVCRPAWGGDMGCPWGLASGGRYKALAYVVYHIIVVCRPPPACQHKRCGPICSGMLAAISFLLRGPSAGPCSRHWMAAACCSNVRGVGLAYIIFPRILAAWLTSPGGLNIVFFSSKHRPEASTSFSC